MAINAEYDPEAKIITCELDGVLKTEVMTQYAITLKRLSEEHDCNRVLVDIRKAESGFSTMDIHSLPEVMESHGVGRLWRRAVLLKSLNDNLRFYEDVSVNRGYQVKMFIDRDQAVKWLTQ